MLCGRVFVETVSADVVPAHHLHRVCFDLIAAKAAYMGMHLIKDVLVPLLLELVAFDSFLFVQGMLLFSLLCIADIAVNLLH